jgi:hypothetical protein
LTQVVNGLFRGLAVESLGAAVQRPEGVQRWVERLEEALELLRRELTIRKSNGPPGKLAKKLKSKQHKAQPEEITAKTKTGPPSSTNLNSSRDNKNAKS